MNAEIIVVGELSDPVAMRQHRLCRKVLSAEGICTCVTAGFGMGGGITAKIIEVYEN